MATKQLGRWKMAGLLGPVGARPGALLRSAVADHCAPPRTRDQDPEGTLLCRVAQSSETGDWMAKDRDGAPLEVRHAGSGLEVWAPPATDDHVGEPVKFKITSPISRDANSGAPGENRPGYSLAEERLAASIAPTEKTGDRNPVGLRGRQLLLDSLYRRR